MPCGWSLRPGQGHQVDDVDDPDLQLGQPLACRICAAATVSMVTTSPAQASTMSGSLLPSSLPAQSQTPAPRAQCSIGLVHGQPLQLRLLVDHDQVHVRP